jgi:hypothetical protein
MTLSNLCSWNIVDNNLRLQNILQSEIYNWPLLSSYYLLMQMKALNLRTYEAYG